MWFWKVLILFISMLIPVKSKTAVTTMAKPTLKVHSARSWGVNTGVALGRDNHLVVATLMSNSEQLSYRLAKTTFANALFWANVISLGQNHFHFRKCLILSKYHIAWPKPLSLSQMPYFEQKSYRLAKTTFTFANALFWANIILLGQNHFPRCLTTYCLTKNHFHLGN